MKILEIRRGGVTQRIATYVTPDVVDQLQGIPPQAVVRVRNPDDSLQVNALSREFLHATIALAAPFDPDMQSAAQTRRDGQFVDAPIRATKSTAP
ncbi:MAG: hypothetical protein EXQ57_10615 [Bryobacterales bacterium]|nr:hypothetical protein [Bryobacterales bacterium]